MVKGFTLGGIVRASALAVALVGVAMSPALAETLLRVAKSQSVTYGFTSLDVGIEQGIFAKHGLKIEASAFGGDAKMMQGLASGAVDIGLGSGPGIFAAVKGAPIIGIAAMADAPRQGVLIVLNDGPKTVEEMKGKTVGVSTTGSLTDFLAHELIKSQNWQASDLNIQPLGATATSVAALKSHQINGMVADIVTAYLLEDEGVGHILFQFGDIVKDFHNHVIYARTGITKDNPDAVREFLAAWFETIKWMKDNRAASVAISARVMGTSPEIADRVYGELMPVFNVSGIPNPKALQVIQASLVANGTIPDGVDITPFIDTEFLPSPTAAE